MAASSAACVRGSSGSDAATARVRVFLTASSRAAKIAPGDPRTVSAHRVVRPCDGTARRREGTADAPGDDDDAPRRDDAIAARAPREATAPIARVMDTRAWVGSIACSPCAARFEVRDSHRTLHVVTWLPRNEDFAKTFSR
jgi:hypothetical protein